MQYLSEEQQRAIFKKAVRREGLNDFRRLGDHYTCLKVERHWRIWCAARNARAEQCTETK